MYGGAKKTKKKSKKSGSKQGKLNLDKLATSTLLVSSAVASLSKGQQKTLKQKIKQKGTKMRKKKGKKMKGKKRIRSGGLGERIGATGEWYYEDGKEVIKDIREGDGYYTDRDFGNPLEFGAVSEVRGEYDDDIRVALWNDPNYNWEKNDDNPLSIKVDTDDDGHADTWLDWDYEKFHWVKHEYPEDIEEDDLALKFAWGLIAAVGTAVGGAAAVSKK